MSNERRSVALLGATGSVGRQTLDVLRAHRAQFDLVAVAGGERIDLLAEIVKEFDVPVVGVKSERHRRELAGVLGSGPEIVSGAQGLSELSQCADVVVNAVVGFAGLPVTLGALGAGRRLALANKESLVAAAPLVAAVRETPGAELLPVDSEHCAIHQCLSGVRPSIGYPDVRRLILTASGGPFLRWSAEQLKSATREDALSHPTWSMGDKITVDSSTLMNKGLEVLEATALFGVGVERVDVVIHPQSVVHSMVELLDGSVIAQMSRPDMRLPISYCLGLPERLTLNWGDLDFSGLTLEFDLPDGDRFPALGLAYAAARRAGAAPAWLSAANEVAVAAFLADQIAWSDVVPVVASVMDHYDDEPVDSVESLLASDAAARKWARASLKR